MPGDLSWVFGSAKDKTEMSTRVKDLSLPKLTSSRNADQDEFGSDTGSKDQQF